MYYNGPEELVWLLSYNLDLIFDQICEVNTQKYMLEFKAKIELEKDAIVIFFYDDGLRGRKILTDFLGAADHKAFMLTDTMPIRSLMVN